MGDAELMTIGRFARLTGLSIHTLRHYDDVSLLIPAHTDPQTGYRRCGRDQIRLAHLIRELRWIGLPIEEVQQVLAETGQAGPVLDSHRQRLLRTRGLLTAQIDNVDRLLEKGSPSGATEVVAPRDRQGMPRSAAVRDPSGNWIWLYQG